MRTFLRQYSNQLFVILFWLAILVAVSAYASWANLTTVEVILQLINLISVSFWGPLIYVLAYTIRPLTLMPSILLSVAAGYIFGPIWGSVLAIIGSNASASLGYFLALYLRTPLEGRFNTSDNVLYGYIERMRANSFETILIMRLIFLPYDPVSLFAGFMRIRWVEFALATFLGGVAGTVSFVLFGYGIEGDFFGQTPEIHPWSLVASIALFVISVAISRLLRQREAQKNYA